MWECALCGKQIADDEEELWGHIQTMHPKAFEEARDWETPDMIEGCYDKEEEE